MTLISFIAFSISTFSQNVPTYIPTSGLVGWWPFTGNAIDSSGNGNDGVVFGASLASDRFGNTNRAYAFNGTSNYIVVNNSSSLQLTQFSISAWIYCPIDTMNVQQEIILKDNYPYNYGINVYGNHKASGFFNSGGNYTQTESPDSVTSGQWHHILFTHNGTIGKLYIDGDSVSSIQGSNILPNNENLYIGSWIGSNYFFKGIIDDIGIWNRALSQQEINYVSSAGDTTFKNNVGVNVVQPRRNLHVNNLLRLEPRNTPPINPVIGDIYMDGQLKKLRVFDGTQWQNCW